MAKFSSVLTRINELQTQILRAAPYRDVSLVPNPGAEPAAIAAAERRLGISLPPSYREFLGLHDGWPRFFEGATLLGCAKLGQEQYEDMARAVFEAAETPLPTFAAAPRERTPIIPFGIDQQGTTLFAFDPSRTSKDGEYEVVAWVNELGIRRESFCDFLEFVLEMCESEVEGYRGPRAVRLSA